MIDNYISSSENIALTANGAQCNQSSSAKLGGRLYDCLFAIDGNSLGSSGWIIPKNEVVGAWISITFRDVYMVNKIRLMESTLQEERTETVEAVFYPGSDKQTVSLLKKNYITIVIINRSTRIIVEVV